MSDTETVTETTPRRRGRPPKNETPVTEKATTVNEVEIEVEGGSTDVVPEKGSEVEIIEYPEGVLLLPAQFEADPWGDTPAQMRG